LRGFLLVSAALLIGGVLAASPSPSTSFLAAGEWRDYAGDTYGLKYSPLAQIDAANVKDLQVAWRWTTADHDVQLSSPLLRASRYEDTPLMANGVLYTVTPLGMVAALDPATGVQRWVYDPHSYKEPKPHSVGWTVRGLAYWSDGAHERIIHSTTDAYLISIDAATGRPDPAFGREGKVDLIEGIPHNAVRSVNYAGRRAVVAGDVLVVGSHIRDALPGKEDQTPPGYVKGFDVHTGKLLWTFHTVPLKGEDGYDTWLEGSAERVGNANAWGGMSYDPQLDYVYIPTSAPGHDFWGGSRPGNNLFSDSLLCLEAKTGKRVWHFQAIHHDLWDYDLPTHPALVDIKVNGRAIKAVVGISKNSFIYVLDRKTGKPVWPINEQPVPQSTTANRERTSPTQPIPTKPKPPETQGSVPENVIDFTPELKTLALEQLQKLEAGPIYTPPSDKGTLKTPGHIGAVNWGGVGFDPETGMLYVPTHMSMDIQKARYPDAPAAAPAAPAVSEAGTPISSATMFVDTLPLIKPPYARVTAINLNTGDHVWMTPIGNGPRNHPRLKDLKLTPLGDDLWGAAPLVTKTLLFVGVTYTFINGRPQPAPWQKWSDPDFERKVLYAFDKRTGAIVHVIEMDSHSVAAPMTYMSHGKQYLVVASGTAENCELVAFALPNHPAAH
jgi:quinoprotein glucose dehydrogenase